MRIRIRLFTLMRIRIQILASKLMLKPLKTAQIGHIPYILACQLQIDADQDPAYHFDADPDAVSDPKFYLMWMRIRIRIVILCGCGSRLPK